MSPRLLYSTYKGATIDDDGDLRCKCGFDMSVSEIINEKSPYFGKKYLACKRSRDDTARCKVYIWHNEVLRIKQLVPRFSKPQTPKKTRDIRSFGVVTPSKSTPRRQTARVNEGDSATTLPRINTNNKRPTTPPPRLYESPSKRPRIMKTPPQTQTNERALTISPPDLSTRSSGTHPQATTTTHRNDRWEQFQRDLLRTPSKSRVHQPVPDLVEEDEEDYCSDWDDSFTADIIRLADQAQAS